MSYVACADRVRLCSPQAIKLQRRLGDGKTVDAYEEKEFDMRFASEPSNKYSLQCRIGDRIIRHTVKFCLGIICRSSQHPDLELPEAPPVTSEVRARLVGNRDMNTRHPTRHQ